MKIPKMHQPEERELGALVTLIKTRKAFKNLEHCEFCVNDKYIHPTGVARTAIGELIAVRFCLEHYCALTTQTERNEYIFLVPCYIVEL